MMKRAQFRKMQSSREQPGPFRISITMIVLLLLSLSGCGNEDVPESTGPIILISVDTLRADHLPIYGANGLDTPHIDALGRDSMVFLNAYSQVPLTLPSHVSMLTGRLPASTGVRDNLGYRVDPSIPSIPTVLETHGYTTGAAVSAYVLRSETGLGDAFDHYDDRITESSSAILGDIQRSGLETVSSAIQWLQGRQDDKVFLMVHLFEPHAPYEPPEPYATRYRDRPYDGEIAAADAAIGELLDYLRESGLYEDATIVLMSDHGEGLGDHGETQHGIFLYREAIRVPLLLKLPGSARSGLRIEAPVALIDLFPTIVEITGVDSSDPSLPGRSLLGTAAEPDPARRIYSETMYPRIHLGWSDLASLVDASHHFIDAPRPELYDLSNDPGETTNVIDAERRAFASMRDQLAGYDRELEAPAQVSAEEAAKLAALGYLGGGSANESAEDLPDPKDRIADLEELLARVHAAGSTSDETAIDALERLVERNPGFADGWILLGRAYDRMGLLEDAVRAYRKSIELSPGMASGIALSLAEAYLKLGRFQEAVDHAILARESQRSRASLVHARALLASGRIDEVDGALEPALADGRTRNEAAVVQAQARVGEGRLRDALVILERSEDGAGQPVPGRSLVKGDVLARMGRTADAKESFRDEIRHFPRSREAFLRLAAIHVLEGNVDEAEELMASLSEKNPSPSTRTMIVNLYRQLGRPDLASRW